MAATLLVSAAEVALRDVKKPTPELKRLWKIKSSIWSLPWKQMANHHGAQSGFHQSPLCRQPLGPGDAPRSNSGHTHRAGQDVSCQAHPQVQRGEAMPHPAEQAGGDTTSPRWAPYARDPARAYFFPTGGGFFHVAPWLLQASQSAGTATP